MRIFLTLCFALLVFSGCLRSDDDCSIDTNCDDYYTQSGAQNAYDLNPECRGDLDADNDGIACEDWADYYQSLGSSVGSNTGSNTGNSGCPNTAACGCSNKNKSPCEASICCKWTTGQGCGCK